MAGDWLKWSKGLAKKPEVLRIAAALGRSRYEVAAILMELWEWADDNVIASEGVSGSDPDKCAGSVRLGENPGQLLDAISGVPGLADSMTAVGWLSLRNGSLEFPNFNRHNGKSAKARALDSSRKQASRAHPVGVPNVSGSQPDKTRTREEKRREETKAVKNHPDSSCPEPPKPAASGPDPLDASLLTFPAVGAGAKEWHLTQQKAAEWAEAFPGVDVFGECRKARQWCIDNPARRKTAKGMPAFLSKWLSRAQNSAPRPVNGPNRRGDAKASGSGSATGGGRVVAPTGDYAGAEARHIRIGGPDASPPTAANPPGEAAGRKDG